MERNYADSFNTLSTAFPWIFGAAVVLILCVWVLMAVTAVRNRRVLRQAGIDPSTAGAQLAVRLLRGESSAPASIPASNRLAELTDLRDRGLITPDEYETRRAQIIGGI